MTRWNLAIPSFFLMSSLHSPLHQTLTEVTARSELLGKIWKFQDASKVSDGCFDPFFKYYTQQCRLALHDFGNHTTVRQHDDLTEIAKDIELKHSRETLVATLRDRIPGPKPANEIERVNTSINLTA